jgi:hypothetical protein
MATNIIRAVDPQSKTVMQLVSMEDVTNGIEKGLILLSPAGNPSKIQSIMGGYLIDGMPIPVALGGPWLAGQREILLPLIKAGKVPQPPADVWNRGVIPVSAEVASGTNAWLTAHGQPTLEASLGGGIPTWLLLGGAAFLIYLFMGSGSSRKAYRSGAWEGELLT